MISLTWPGKPREVPLIDPANIAIDEVVGEAREDSNRLIAGDNLAVAAALRPAIAGKIRLLYIDPPFASGADYHQRAGVRERTSRTQAYGDTWSSHEEFLSFLYLRLLAFRELLAPDGMLWLHLDDNSVHEAKLLCDEIFGADCYRGEIVWRLGNGAKSRKFFSVQHNTILAYSKGKSWVFHPDEPRVREPFADVSQKMHFNNVDAEGRRFRRRTINGKDYIYYADEGKLLGSVWTDIASMVANSPVLAESTGYPTQKPKKLIERIIAACTDPDDLVADFFAGSGTTLAAAYSLGRRWLGVDCGSIAHMTARSRLIAEGAQFSATHPPDRDFSFGLSLDDRGNTTCLTIAPESEELEAWSVDSSPREGAMVTHTHVTRSRKQDAIAHTIELPRSRSVRVIAFAKSGRWGVRTLQSP